MLNQNFNLSDKQMEKTQLNTPQQTDVKLNQTGIHQRTDRQKKEETKKQLFAFGHQQAQSELKQDEFQNQNKAQNEYVNISQYLEQQLERYKIIETQITHQKDKGVVKRIMSSIETQLDKLKFNTLDPITVNNSKFGEISLIEEQNQTDESFYSNSKIQAHLKEIYKFYSKISYVRGPSDDFNRINHESNTMSEGKFIIFCRQFGLLEKRIHHIKTQSKIDETSKLSNNILPPNSNILIKNTIHNDNNVKAKYLSFKELNNLFRRVNKNQNEVTYMSFLQLLQELSQLMFDKEPKIAENLLYKFMKVDTQEFRKQFKSLYIPFNSKDQPGFRKPEGLSCQRYENHSTDQLKSKRLLIDDWKKSKQEQLREKLIVQTNQSRSRSTLFEPLYVKTSSYKERKLRKDGLYANSHQIVNWEKLDSLDPKLILLDEFKPADLIQEDEDNEDKYYLKSYDLSRSDKKSDHKPLSTEKRVPGFKMKTETTNRRTQISTKIDSRIEQNQAYFRLPKLRNK
ncbi:unnamed protein product (macronuclear) [Paramecium tetraurelia]|uniref:EF-hand domain-containing protein n=1 Tax=Paramecium tetraurelia TaxID=5888 RepID=A0DUT9_PARTE|nr:uncharacterized protein GSPATT00020468001 [Paramecium tetraurelia]CAK86806.1 unnamed protein product [Paramecium tetraurelia]|eukprot:XP_001454203.1 hypothetical protein (macronuclear) [Paramecium tetraurelia strain d4-2]